MKLLLESWRKYLTEAVGVEDMEYIADRIKDEQLNNRLEGEYDLDDFLGYFPEDDRNTLMMVGGPEAVESYLLDKGEDFFTVNQRLGKISF
jgi:hypothetical protein